MHCYQIIYIRKTVQDNYDSKLLYLGLTARQLTFCRILWSGDKDLFSFYLMRGVDKYHFYGRFPPGNIIRYVSIRRLSIKHIHSYIPSRHANKNVYCVILQHRENVSVIIGVINGIIDVSPDLRKCTRMHVSYVCHRHTNDWVRSGTGDLEPTKWWLCGRKLHAWYVFAIKMAPKLLGY